MKNLKKKLDQLYFTEPNVGRLSMAASPAGSGGAVITNAGFDGSLDAGTALIAPVVTRTTDLAVVKDGVANWARAASENILVYSDNLAGTGWNQVEVSISGTSGVIASTNNTSHYVYQDTLSLTNGQQYCLSALIKPVNQNYVRFMIEAVGLFAYADFNLSTGALAGGADYDAADISGPDADGYYTVYMVATYNNGAGCSTRIYVSDRAGGTAYTGDGTSIEAHIKNAMLAPVYELLEPPEYTQTMGTAPVTIPAEAAYSDGGLFNPAPVENLLLYNKNLSNAVWDGNTSNTSGQEDIFGGTDGWIVEDIHGASMLVEKQDISIAAGTDMYCAMVYMKKKTTTTAIPRFIMYWTGGSTTTTFSVRVHPVTGDTEDVNNPNSGEVEVLDLGDWWGVQLLGADPAGRNNTNLEIRIAPADSATMTGSQDATLRDSVTISHPMLFQTDTYPGPIVIPTEGSAVSIGTQTIAWELGQGLMDYLSTAEGHATAKGRLTCEVTPYFKSDQVTSGNDALITVNSTTAASLLYWTHTAAQTQFKSYDGTTAVVVAKTHDPNVSYKVSVTWDSAAGTLVIDVDGTEDSDSFDGVFEALDTFIIGYSNDTPFAIKDVLITGLGGPVLTPFKRVEHSVDQVIHSTDRVVHTHPA